MDRKNFYKKKVSDHIKDINSSVLILGAGNLDEDVFKELKFQNVKLSNIDNQENMKNIDIQTLHNLKIENEKYDYCVAHACIHHSSKPHNAILEMYRVSKKGILIIEATDSFISKLACRLNLSEEFEVSAVKKNKTYGGVDNSSIPNYVFRWTEREIYKLFSSYKPEIIHNIKYDYGHHLKFTKSLFIKFFFKLFFHIFKKQQNLFSIFVDKNSSNFTLRKW